MDWKQLLIAFVVGGAICVIGQILICLLYTSKAEDKDETIFEIADLCYHVMVLMVQSGISLKDVTAELEKRHVVDHKVKQERMQ